MVFEQAVLPCITWDCTFGVLVLPIFQRRVLVSASYVVTFILTKDISVLGTAPWRISMGNPSGIRMVNFIVMMGICEKRKITTNMGVLLQERYRQSSLRPLRC